MLTNPKSKSKVQVRFDDWVLHSAQLESPRFEEPGAMPVAHCFGKGLPVGCIGPGAVGAVEN